ncbi:MAG: RadC family protein [Clostridia bacterium]|nr:RadC family protein [Clostridia bacterium]MBR6553738.1 RadC family protein [Clostridia bacterium]
MGKEYPHAGHRERLREKYRLGGEQALTETEFLELLLFFSIPRVDTRPLAETLIEAFGSLDGVLAASPEEIRGFANLNGSTEVLFSVIRYLTDRSAMRMRECDFRDPAFAADYLPGQFAGYKKERAVLFYLDGGGSLLHRQTAMSSEEDAVQLSLRTVLETAKKVGASALVIAHNHPNGIAKPSSADLTATTRMREELQKEGLSLLEHYIIAGDACVPILGKENPL